MPSGACQQHFAAFCRTVADGFALSTRNTLERVGVSVPVRAASWRLAAQKRQRTIMHGLCGVGPGRWLRRRAALRSSRRWSGSGLSGPTRFEARRPLNVEASRMLATVALMNDSKVSAARKNRYSACRYPSAPPDSVLTAPTTSDRKALHGGRKEGVRARHFATTTLAQLGPRAALRAAKHLQNMSARG